MTSMAYGNSTTKTMLYDARYRPQENKLTTATAVIADYLYQEDAVGNITQIHDATNATFNRDFGYDDLNRVTTANSGTSLWGNGGYQYDAMGNMTSLHIGNRSLSFSYLGTTPRIQSVSGTAPTTVQYDNVGNELTSGTYSPRNLLHPIAGSDGMPDPGQSQNVQFTYDGRGVRIASSVTTPGPRPWGGTTTRRSIYSPELNLLAQYDSSGIDDGGGPAGTEYLWFGGQPAAQAFTDLSQPLRYTFTDHLGTPILQTNPSATVVWRAEYEPYGSVYAYRVGDESDPQALRLPGQEAADPIVGQNYNIFRWYRSEWGRYTQADPIGLNGGIDLYAYGNEDPLQFDDTNGLSFVDVRKTDEKRFKSLDEYQHQNPCHDPGTSYSCTQRLLEDIACPCSCKGTGWGMDVSAIVQVRYNLAGGQPGSNMPPTFFWNGYRRHEDLHLNDLRTKLKEYADALETQRYDSATECNIACGKIIGGFHQWLNDWAADSNRRLH